MKLPRRAIVACLWAGGAVSGAVTLVAGVLWLCPIKMDSLASRPAPAASFTESLERIAVLRRSDPPNLHPDGRTILLDHGRATERAVVLFHGFTNSPRQFKALGVQLHALGYNVLIPRLPHHGAQDAQSSQLQNLRAEDLAGAADEAVDIARGLGRHVTVVGLSMGGLVAGWAAQFRNDVELAVLIAPNFGTYRVANILLKPSINYLLLRPNRTIWWDRQKRETLSRPPTAYYGFPSRALGEVRRLGWMVQSSGRRAAPAAGSILVVTNANDRAVSKEGIEVIINNWKRRGAGIRTYEFPAELGLGHDLIDPEQPNQNTALVYPRLISLITGT